LLSDAQNLRRLLNDRKNDRGDERRDDGKCFVCGRKGYLARDCFHTHKTTGITNSQGSGYRRNVRKSPQPERNNDFRNDRFKQKQEIQYLKES